MPQRILFSVFLIVGLSLPKAQASVGKSLCDGFVPENELNIPVGYRLNGAPTGITEAQFEAVLDRMQSLYDADFAKRGVTFTIKRNWTNGTVNAFAVQSGKDWQIHMYGGLARFQGMTPDGFAAVACHEVGHHLGGAPKYDGTGWAATEGQSDYFTTLKCMRRFFEKDDNETIISGMKLDPLAIKKCEAQFNGRPDQLLCIRGSTAGIVLGTVLQTLSSAKPVSLATPDTSVVKKTFEGHPKAQCRLDTYFNGALCTVPYVQETSDSNTKDGTCWDASLTAQGLRPLCWYKP